MCMCICTCIRIRIRICICICICIYVSIYISIHLYIGLQIYIYIYIPTTPAHISRPHASAGISEKMRARGGPEFLSAFQSAVPESGLVNLVWDGVLFLLINISDQTNTGMADPIPTSILVCLAIPTSRVRLCSGKRSLRNSRRNQRVR